MKVESRIFIDQKDNDYFFDQKAKTFRKGFEWKKAVVTICDDPGNKYIDIDDTPLYKEGEFGKCKIYGVNVYVYRNNINSNDWDIDRQIK